MHNNRARKMKKSENLKHTKRGATAAEYGILGALVAVAAIFTVSRLGNTVANTFSTSTAMMSESQSGSATATGGESGAPLALGAQYVQDQGYSEDALVLSVQTSAARPTARLRVYSQPEGAEKIIDWGDGSTFTTTADTWITHTYAGTGSYDIQITGDIYHFDYYSTGADRAQITNLYSWGSLPLGDITAGFARASNLEYVAPIPSSVTRAGNLFWNATANPSGLEAWDVSNVQNFDGMFQNNEGTSILTADLSGWAPSNATSMAYMFSGASNFSGDLSGWCAPGISSAPTNFATGAGAVTPPAWGDPC
jgi:Flp pilus assembly pilin Flp